MKINWLLIFLFLSYPMTNTSAIEPTSKINVAVFHFVNNTDRMDMNVLQYSLREKLNKNLTQNNHLYLIELQRINRMMEKRDMNVKDNIKNPRILQYIGGLVDAEILISGHFTLDNDSIIILTNVIDAKQGKVIKRYRANGSLGYVNSLVDNIAKNIIQDMPAWQTQTDLPDNASMAHKLGKIVAQTEIGIDDKPNLSKKTSPPDYEKYILNIIRLKLNIQKFIITEANNIISKDTRNSIFRNILGWIFLARSQQHLTINPELALKDLKTAKYFLPYDNSINHLLAKIYTDKQNYSAAIETYMSIIQDNPDDISAYLGIGNTYLLKKSYFPSIFFLAQGIKKDPYRRELYILLAEAYERSNQPANTVSTILSALKIFPDDTDLKKLLEIYRLNERNPYSNR